MFIPNTSEDISQKEYEQYISPYFDELKYYIEEYIIPEICAYAIALGYIRNALYYESLDLHLSHDIELFNNDIDKTENIKNNVKQILKDKYFLNTLYLFLNTQLLLPYGLNL